MSTEARKTILDAVGQAILKERQTTYGQPEDCFNKIARYWSVYLGEGITAVQVADMMELLKIARRQSDPCHLDNYIDGAGYAVIAGELAGVAEDAKALESVRKRDQEAARITNLCCQRIE